MQEHQQAFVDLLIRFDVVRFGDFTLKSGRKSPYFVNAGQLRTGDAIAGLGRAFAAEIDRAGLACDTVFGPSYKGVPLAVATATALSERRGNDIGFSFDRKEAKDHGEGGTFVGTQPTAGMSVVVVDDVITSGRSIREAVSLLRSAADVDVTGVVVAVDRMERGRGDQTTLVELEAELKLGLYPVVDVRSMVEYLYERPMPDEIVVGAAEKAAIEAYLAEHGSRG
jgi:orotate phosphoribosyltransferase